MKYVLSAMTLVILTGCTKAPKKHYEFMVEGLLLKCKSMEGSTYYGPTMRDCYYKVQDTVGKVSGTIYGASNVLEVDGELDLK